MLQYFVNPTLIIIKLKVLYINRKLTLVVKSIKSRLF